MATCQPTLPKHNLLAREDKRALSSFGQLVIYVNSINYDGDTLSVRGPVLICLLFIHSYLIFYFICSCFGCEWKSREPSTASEKKLSPPGDPNAYMQLDHCEREIEKIWKTHVMYKNKRWGEAL